MISAVFSHLLRCNRAATRALAVVLAVAAGPALGQTRGTWNVDADGLWSGSSNWLNNTIAGGISGTATFANNITATRTITLDTNRSLGGFIFGDANTSSAASWIVTGSTMTMNNGVNSATITVNALGTGATATISSVLASSTSPSIIKNGVGTLVLGATNTFTGKLEITEGTLQISTDRNLGGVGTFATDRITISNGATLRTSAAVTLSGSRGITIGSGGGTLSVNGGGLTYSGRLTGAGNTATVTGANPLTLTNTTGIATDVNWDFSSNNSIKAFFEGANALGTGTVTVRNGVRLVSQTLSSGTLANAITLDSGAGLTARSSGGALVYQNVIFPSSGTVSFNNDDQTTSTLTITSSGSLAGDLTVLTTQGGSNAVGSVFLDGVFSGAGGLVKSGTGVSGLVVLRGANTYTGTTSINAGTLQLGNGGLVGRLSTSSVITGSAGGTLVFNRSDTISSGTHFNNVVGGAINVTQVGSGTVILAGDNTYTGTTSINAGTLQLGNGGAAGALSTSSEITGLAGATLAFKRSDTVSSGTHFNSVIGGAINVTQVGSGTVILAGDNTYTGTTSINAGSLQLGNGGTAGALSTSSVITGSAGATLVFNRSDTISSSTHFNNVIGGAINVAQIGTGTVVFSGSNAYTGATAINAGVLALGSADALAGGGDIGFGGGSLQFTAGNTSDYSARIRTSGSAISIDTNAQAVTFANTLDSTNTGGLTKLGSGTLTLSASNAYTGKTSITNGTLEIRNNGSLGAAPGSFTADQVQISNGATLRTNGAVNLVSGSGMNRGITIGTGTATISVNGGILTAGRFTGEGNTVTVIGANGLTLQNTTGTATNVNWDFSSNSGVRAFFDGANALGTGTVTVRSGVRLTSQTVASGTLTNAVTLDSGAGLTARSSGGAVTYTNVIFPSSGTVVFNRDDQATSNLTITSGGSLTGNLTVDTAQGGANAVADVFLDGVFSGAGGLVKAGTGASGRLVLRGANTYTGDTTISTGTLQLGAAGSIASSGTINVTSGASFDVSAVSGGFSLAAGQVLKGSGTVVGDVTAALGTIAPGSSPGTLTFADDLSLDSGSFLNFELSGTNTTVGAGINDLIVVSGTAFALDGTINVSEIVAGSFLSATETSVWRLFNYSGTFTDGGLLLGTMPALSSGLTFELDTATAGQVNLIVTSVPEPATIATALVGLGLAGGVAARRRRARVGW